MQHAVRFIAGALLLFIAGAAQAQFSTLIWSDEFNDSGLPDSTKWNYDVGGHGWGNNELQYYTEERTKNARVENGNLIIEAHKESYQGNTYTSARLVTREKGDWTYGRIEVRAKLPEGLGTWPAIWMLPTEWIYGNGSWPDNGEIDIMEHVGYDPGVVHGTIHTRDHNHGDGTQVGEQIAVPTAMDSFHVYALEWTKDELRWYVDDEHYFTYQNEGKGWSSWPFDHPFHLLLNIAVGGNWGGAEGVNPDAFPARMEVDYVRVYKRPEKLNNIIDGPGQLMPYAEKASYAATIQNANSYEWTVPEGVEIVGKADTSHIQVNWGCSSGTIDCRIFMENDTLNVSKSVEMDSLQIKAPLYYNETDDPLHFIAPAMHHTEYSWTVPADAEILEGAGNDTLMVDWGSHSGTITLTTDNDCGLQEAEKQIFSPGTQLPYPDYRNPAKLPGIIRAADYDRGGPGVAYKDNDAGNTGNGPRQGEDVDTEYQDAGKSNVGWIESGEWLEYSIKPDSSFFADVKLRVATDNFSGGTLSIYVNGEERLGNVTTPGTGGWGAFETMDAGIMHFNEGDTLIRVFFDQGGFNLAAMRFEATENTGLVTEEQTNVQVFPNPARHAVTYQADWRIQRISIWDMSGRVVAKYAPKSRKKGSLSLSRFDKGLYIMRFTGKNNRQARIKLQCM